MCPTLMKYAEKTILNFDWNIIQISRSYEYLYPLPRCNDTEDKLQILVKVG
jgi:hypothetical protein